MKDSIYGAVGIAAQILYDDLDFNAFMTETLVLEVQVQGPGYRILRRRAAIMVEQWSQVTKINRKVVYEIFRHLLNPDDPINDHVVRVTAARQFRFIIDQWSYSIPEFVPFAPEIISRMIDLIPEVTLEETKLTLLHGIQVIVDRMGREVVPLAEKILAALSALWGQAEDKSLRKNTILDVLKTLINSLKEYSHQWHGLAIPLVERCVDPSAGDYHQMIDDGVGLWAAIVSNAPEPTAELMALTRCLMPLYEVGLETIEEVMELTQGYIILAPEPMIQHFEPFLQAFNSMLRHHQLFNGLRHQILATVELELQLARMKCTASQLELYVAQLHSSGLLPLLLDGLRSSYNTKQYTGPSPPTPIISVPTECDYFSMLARIAFASPSTLVAALTAAGPGTFDETVRWVFEEWFDHFNSFPTANVKKLNCLGLTNLLALGPLPWLMSHLQDYMTMWTTTCYECCDDLPPEHGGDDYEDSHKLGRDTLVWAPLGPWTGSEEDRPSPGDRRKSQLEHEDPVHSISVRDFVAQALRSTVEACGGQERFSNEWLVNVDKDVVTSFTQMAIM